MFYMETSISCVATTNCFPSPPPSLPHPVSLCGWRKEEGLPGPWTFNRCSAELLLQESGGHLLSTC